MRFIADMSVSSVNGAEESLLIVNLDAATGEKLSVDDVVRGGSSILMNSTSFCNVVINLTNSIIGSGILGIPFGFSESGFVLGIFLMIFSTVLAIISMNVLVHCSHIYDSYTFSGIAKHSYGTTGEAVVNIFMFLSSVGCMLTYQIVIGDTLPPIIQVYTSQQWLSNRENVILLTSCLVILPSLFFSSIGKLSKLSSISIMCLPIVSVIVFMRCFFGPEYNTTGATFDSEKLKNVLYFGPNVFSSLGIFAFSAVSTQSTFLMYITLKKPSLKRWMWVTIDASILFLGAGLSLGIVGFVAFGTSAEGNILNTLPMKDEFVNVSRLLIALSVLLSFPMQFYPARHALLQTLGKGHDTNNVSSIPFLLATAFMFLCSTGISLLVSNLGLVFELVGSVSCSALGYIIPSLIYMQTFGTVRIQSYRQFGWRNILRFSCVRRIDMQDSIGVDHVDDQDTRKSFEIPVNSFLDFSAIVLVIFGIGSMIGSTANTLYSALK